MANEITAQKITIQKNMGLTQALKAHVLQNNYKMSDGSINAKEWNKTIDVLESINEKRKKSGVTPIFTGGTDRSRAGWHTSFVVHPNQEIEFTKEEMKELYEAMGVSIDGSEKSDKQKEVKTKKNKVEQTADEKSQAKAEKKRIKEELKAEKKRQRAEKKAEKERLNAEKKAEKERIKAEKKAEKERIKAEKKQAKADLEHDKVAIDVVVPREIKSRRTAQSKFDKANKVLTNIAYDKANPYIKVDNETEDGKTYTTKIAKVKERYVKARYDNNGELVDVEINIDNSKKHYAPDVKYTAVAAYADTKEKKPGYEVGIANGFDFEAIKRVIARIFGRESK